RVLVAVMPQAAVGHAGQQAEVYLGVVAAGRHPAAARLAVAVGGDRRRAADRARRRLRRVLAADHRRGQLGPARLAEVVPGADRPAAVRARRGRRWTGGHDQVLGRTPLASSTSSIRRWLSGASRAWAR